MMPILRSLIGPRALRTAATEASGLGSAASPEWVTDSQRGKR